MTGLAVQGLVATINKLDSLGDDGLLRVLSHMRLTLCANTKHDVMSLQEFKKIITHLVSLKNNGTIDLFSSMSSELTCYDIDKRVHNIPRSLAFVRESKEEAFKLYILTDRKYYDRNSKKSGKYDYDNKEINLGKGSYKSVKACLSIVFSDGNLTIAAAAKQTVRICTFTPAFNQAQQKQLREVLFPANNQKLEDLEVKHWSNIDSTCKLMSGMLLKS